MAQHCPNRRELDDLELLLSGAYAPLSGFNEPGSVVRLDSVTKPATLVDPEGLPLADVDEAGHLSPLSTPEFGPFRRFYLTPAQVRDAHAGAHFVPVSQPLTDAQLSELQAVDASVVILALVGTGRSTLSATGLLKAILADTAKLAQVHLVAVPLPSHADAAADAALLDTVVGNYAAGDPILELSTGGAPSSAAAQIVQSESRPREAQGLVLFFSGLSGSGKSTLARALMDLILEQTDRTVTSLDGDVVRRHLSAGLGFSREDREMNIRRIGWVAAEIARHGGVAVCSPIAPFAATRDDVRAMADDAGAAFFLVHVATPLEECERRDRKGLYAKARAGEIPDFTGISSPYEEPTDAAVRVDTTGRTIEAALAGVVEELRAEGYVDLELGDS